jgi:NTE family protein
MNDSTAAPSDTGLDAKPRSARAARSAGQQKAISLALQGGGAHGAFTWGVLDRLLEDARIHIEGISATSSGAINATVFAYGLATGGREGARRALAGFWRRVGHVASFGPVQASLWDKMTGNHSLRQSPTFLLLDLLTRLLSPYECNPLNYNPLRHVLLASVNFATLRTANCPLKLFLSATNVRTGKLKIFDKSEICVDSVLASSCLPLLFQAVEIDGQHYWDGGYMGNPAIFPLIYHCDGRDVLIVHINPLDRNELPITAAEIMNRMNEISFNSSLMREMRAIYFVTKLLDDDPTRFKSLKRMLMHSISADEVMSGLGVASKLNGDWGFLTYLRDKGREHADVWLERNFDRLGRESTIDIRTEYF